MAISEGVFELQPGRAGFSGWARVDVMGHQSHWGQVTTHYFGDVAVLHISTPEAPAEEVDHLEEDYWGGPTTRYRLRLDALPASERYVPAHAIYGITPLTEAEVRAVVNGNRQELSRTHVEPEPPSAAPEAAL